MSVTSSRCDSKSHRPQIRSYLHKWAKIIPTKKKKKKIIPTTAECTAQRQNSHLWESTIHRVKRMSSRMMLWKPSLPKGPVTIGLPWPYDTSWLVPGLAVLSLTAPENSVWHGCGLGLVLRRWKLEWMSRNLASHFGSSTNGFWSWTSLPWLRDSQLVRTSLCTSHCSGPWETTVHLAVSPHP